jgi:hypothetical protein
MSALLFGVAGSRAVAAMLSGIVTWSVVCAVIAASEPYVVHVETGPWRRNLQLALWIRAMVTVAGASLMLLAKWLPGGGGLFATLDLFAGMTAIRLSGWLLSGLTKVTGDIPQEFASVYLTTLIQGAWVLATVVGLAAIIHVIRRFGRCSVPLEGT